MECGGTEEQDADAGGNCFVFSGLALCRISGTSSEFQSLAFLVEQIPVGMPQVMNEEPAPEFPNWRRSPERGVNKEPTSLKRLRLGS